MEVLSKNCSTVVGLLTIKKSGNSPSASVRSFEKPKNLKFGSAFNGNLLRRLLPPLASPSSSTTEAHKGVVVSENERGSQSKTVLVKFVLQKQCLFGEQFFLVGDDPVLGLWDPLDAIPMSWSDDHIWTAELDIPVGLSIQFKIILKGLTGESHWQPGPDRIIRTWDTSKTIVVYEDWANAELQKIMEEELLISSSDESNVTAGAQQEMVVGDKSPESSDKKKKTLKNGGGVKLVPGMAPSAAPNSASSVPPRAVNGKTRDGSLASDVAKSCNSSQLCSKQEDTEASHEKEDETEASNDNMLADETTALSDKPTINCDSDATETFRGTPIEDKSHQKVFGSQSMADLMANDIWRGLEAFNRLLLNMGFGMNASGD